jgi:molecular chaperone GrpE
MASENTRPSTATPDDPPAGDDLSAQRATGEAGSAAAGDQDMTAEALRAEATENWNRYLRAVADLENLRKRNVREVENARKFGVERLAAGLLPVKDSIEAGLKAAEEADPASLDVATIIEGVRATLRLLDQALDAAGIREFDPAGEPFDPLRHEAMSMLPSSDLEPGSVMMVVQKGYELNERIVRPARVIVSQAPAESGGSPGGS